MNMSWQSVVLTLGILAAVVALAFSPIGWLIAVVVLIVLFFG